MCRATLCEYNDATQFTEILARQNGLDQPSIANFSIRFVLGVSGACNKTLNNPRHVIDTLERTVNCD